MVVIRNASSNRTIVHQDGDRYYRIEPLSTLEVDEDIAKAIFGSWPDAMPISPSADVGGRTECWEEKCGPIFEKAKIEFNIKPIKQTVGPDRLEVVEPPQPIDGEKNFHACPQCGQEFETLQGCRLHQKKIHKS